MVAGNWRPEYNRYFKDKDVVILPDNDAPGRKHALSVARHLQDTAKSIKILELPGLPEKGDVSNWLEAGGTAEELQSLAGEAPEWISQAMEAPYHPHGIKGGSTGSKPRGSERGGLRAVGSEEEPEFVRVKTVLPDAPVGDRIVVPDGWSLSG
jgi:hypothetical protein